jgi:hydrogenase maturation protease
LHCLLEGKPYLVGPLARLNLNQDRLPEQVSGLMGECGISFPSRNMFHSIIARAIELYLALLEAQRLLAGYDQVDDPYEECKTVAGTGTGCTEAPRGILWHQYQLNASGQVEQARIVPPTSQNQARIEQDLHDALVRIGLDRKEDALRLHAEKVIRNYDPCISCATHFLRLNINQCKKPDTTGLDFRDHAVLKGKVSLYAVGSPLGNDRFAWDVATAIEDDHRFSQVNLQVTKLDRPGAQLLNELGDNDQVIIVDAMLADITDKKILLQDWGKHPGLSGSQFSSHEVDLASALQLGAKLGSFPGSLFVAGMVFPESTEVQYSDEDVAEMKSAIYAFLGI